MTAGEEWPSCREAVSAATRSEITGPTVLRNVWGVTQSRLVLPDVRPAALDVVDLLPGPAPRWDTASFGLARAAGLAARVKRSVAAVPAPVIHLCKRRHMDTWDITS